MKNIKELKKYIQKNILHIFLVLVLILFILYIFSETFRCYLLKENIDPNFIIGFLTAIALSLSVMQSLYDKKFNYNMRLIESMENKGLNVIGKLLAIKHKSETFFITLQQHKKAIENKQIYQDFNDTLSSKDVNDGMELIGAYIDTYFHDESVKWNEIIEKLRIIGTYSNSVSINYNENIALIIEETPFNNKVLENIDHYISEAEKINKEIDKLTAEMRDRIILKINDNSGKLKDFFNFRI